MSSFEVEVRHGSWAVSRDGWRFEATGIIRDRGTIRCTLSVAQAGRLIFRDNTSLTGDRSRGRVLRRIRDLVEHVPDWIGDNVLLVLDETIRSTPSQPSTNGHKKPYDTPTDISYKVTSLSELIALIKKWLLWDDDDALAVVLGAVIAHRLGGESPWLLLVAPPSGTKTELLRMLWGVEGVYPLSELTARTFASGLETQGSDPSLLARLHDEILVLKDLTTVLEMHREERQAVLAQLREIYDGRFDKAWGTGKELHWEGRLGLLAGVTPVIDQHHTVMGLLGPRFLQLRLKTGDRQKIATKAMRNAQHEVKMRQELAVATAAFLTSIGNETLPLTVPDELVASLAALADLVTRARSPVVRDGYRREFEYAPEPESPARLARQLHALLQGITVALGLDCADSRAGRIVIRVALDCIPAIRRLVLQTLKARPESERVKTTDVAKSAQYATNTVRLALEDLQALGLVVREKADTEGKADLWALSAEGRAMMDTLHEMSEGRHIVEGNEAYIDCATSEVHV